MTKKTIQLSRLIDLSDVRDHGSLELDLRATPDECAALAKRFGILEVTDLNAYVTITRGARPDLYKIEGDLTAHVIQECCVTLSPVPERVQDSFDELLTTSASALPKDEEADFDPQLPVDVIRDDRVELGEIVAQWLALALNPYPRVDAPPFQHIEADAQKLDVQTPFKVLENLRGK